METVQEVMRGPNGGYVEFTHSAHHGRESLLALLIPHAVVNRDVTLYLGEQGRWLRPQDVDCTAWAASGDERCVLMHQSFDFVRTDEAVLDLELLAPIYTADDDEEREAEAAEDQEHRAAVAREAFGDAVAAECSVKTTRFRDAALRGGVSIPSDGMTKSPEETKRTKDAFAVTVGRRVQCPPPTSLVVRSGTPERVYAVLEYFPRLTALRLHDRAQMDIADVAEYIAPTLVSLDVRGWEDDVYEPYYMADASEVRPTFCLSHRSLPLFTNLRVLRFDCISEVFDASAVLRGFPELEVLEIAHLHREQAETAATAMAQLTRLRVLTLTYCSFTLRKYQEMARGMRSLERLVLTQGSSGADLDQWLPLFPNLRHAELNLDAPAVLPPDIDQWPFTVECPYSTSNRNAAVLVHNLRRASLCQLLTPPSSEQQTSDRDWLAVQRNSRRDVPPVNDDDVADLSSTQRLPPMITTGPPCLSHTLLDLTLQCPNAATPRPAFRRLVECRALTALRIEVPPSEHDVLFVMAGMTKLTSLTVSLIAVRKCQQMHAAESFREMLASIAAGEADETPYARAVATQLLTDTTLVTPPPSENAGCDVKKRIAPGASISVKQKNRDVARRGGGGPVEATEAAPTKWSFSLQSLTLWERFSPAFFEAILRRAPNLRCLFHTARLDPRTAIETVTTCCPRLEVLHMDPGSCDDICRTDYLLLRRLNFLSELRVLRTEMDDEIVAALWDELPWLRDVVHSHKRRY